MRVVVFPHSLLQHWAGATPGDTANTQAQRSESVAVVYYARPTVVCLTVTEGRPCDVSCAEAIINSPKWVLLDIL